MAWALALGMQNLTLKSTASSVTLRSLPIPHPIVGKFCTFYCGRILTDMHHEIPMIVPMRVSRFPAKEVYNQASIEIASYLIWGKCCRLVKATCSFMAHLCTFERLVADYTIEMVPGVSSIMAGASMLGRPLLLK